MVFDEPVPVDKYLPVDNKRRLLAHKAQTTKQRPMTTTTILDRQGSSRDARVPRGSVDAPTEWRQMGSSVFLLL
jgi:hypothetical protein